MRGLREFLSKMPHGQKGQFAKENHIQWSVLYKWRDQDIYYIHEGCLYKRVRRLKNA
jgi:hypothetical protein